MFSLYTYMFCSDITNSQHLEYFTSLWLAKVVIYITYLIYYRLLLTWGDRMSHGKSSPCHLSGLLTHNFLIVTLDLLGQVKTLQFEQSNPSPST